MRSKQIVWDPTLNLGPISAIINLQAYKFFCNKFVTRILTLDLDLDSTRTQVDALGHTLMPFWSVKSCHLCFFPGGRHLSQIFLDCAYPVSSWSNLPV